MILCTFLKGADGKLLRKIMADLAELSINKALERLYVSRERNRKLFLRGSRKRLWSSCLLGVLLWQFCPQGSAKATTENKFWLLNSEGNRDGIFVKGRRQTLLYCYKWGQRKHVILRKIRKIAWNRTLTSKEPWNKNGSKSTNHKLQTVTFWTLWNEHLLLKRSAKWRW